MAKRVVDVLVPVALDRAYSYRVPRRHGAERRATSSACRSAPREATAVVWAENPNPNPRLDNRLKDVERKARRAAAASRNCARFVDWVANYTLSARAAWCCACACGWASISAPERVRVGVRLAGAPPQRMTPARRRAARSCSPTACCAARSEAAQRSRRQRRRDRWPDRRRHAGDRGAAAASRSPPAPDPAFRARRISRRQQRAAADAMRALAANGVFTSTLLDGVTGSGKTEVYFEAVAEAIRARPADA